MSSWVGRGSTCGPLVVVQVNNFEGWAGDAGIGEDFLGAGESWEQSAQGGDLS